MSTVTPFHATRLGEFIADREQAAADEVQFHTETRAELLHSRIEEIQAARMKALSTEDLQYAFEKLSTDAYLKTLAALREDLLTHSQELTSAGMHGMIRGMILLGSIEKAHAEFAKLDEAKDGDHH